MKKVILFLTLLFCLMPAHAALSESESILALSDTHLSGDPLMHAVMMDAVIRTGRSGTGRGRTQKWPSMLREFGRK